MNTTELVIYNHYTEEYETIEVTLETDDVAVEYDMMSQAYENWEI